MRLQDKNGKLQNIMMEYMKILVKLVERVESANAANKQRESWQIINEMSSSKTSKQGAIKGNCKEERLEKWCNHFNNLLRRAQVLEDECTDDDLPKVSYGLDIRDCIYN